MHISTIQRTNIGSQLRHIVPLVLTLCLFTSCNFGTKPEEAEGGSSPVSTPPQATKGAVVVNSSPVSTPPQATKGAVVVNSSPVSTPPQADQGEAEEGPPSGLTPAKAAQKKAEEGPPSGLTPAKAAQKKAEEGPPSGSTPPQATKEEAEGGSTIPLNSLNWEEITQQAATQVERVRRFCKEHQEKIFSFSEDPLSIESLRQEIAAGKSPQEVFSLIKERLGDPKKTFEPSEQITLLTDCVRYGQVNAEAMAGKDAVIVLGNTGAGKSTFINYLAGCQLEEKESPLEPILEVRGTSSGGGQDEVAPIGHGTTSKTFMPHVVSVDDQVYCDCPGFRDNRGVEINIANAVNIKQALSQAQSLRMVVLVDYPSLRVNRGNIFQDLLRTLTDLLGSEATIVEHQGSILLGISKCPGSSTREKFQNVIVRYIPRSLSSLKDRLFIFNPISPEEGWDQAGCLAALNSLDKVSDTSFMPSVSLNEQDLTALYSLVEAMQNEIDSLLYNKEDLNAKEIGSLLYNKEDLNAAFEKYCYLAQISVIDHQIIWSLLSSTWKNILNWVQQQEQEFRSKYTKGHFEEAEKLLEFLQEVANVFSLDASEIDPSSLRNELDKAHQSSVEEQEKRSALQEELLSLQEQLAEVPSSQEQLAELLSLKESLQKQLAELSSLKEQLAELPSLRNEPEGAHQSSVEKEATLKEELLSLQESLEKRLVDIQAKISSLQQE